MYDSIITENYRLNIIHMNLLFATLANKLDNSPVRGVAKTRSKIKQNMFLASCFSQLLFPAFIESYKYSSTHNQKKNIQN